MTKTKTFLAAVMVTCHVDGKRTDIQPGEPLPEDLSDHDVEQLLRLGAIRDPEAEAAEAKAATKVAKAAQAEFAQAKAAVQAAQDSIQPPAAPAGA